MTYKHGHVVSIPDPHERRPSRPVVIISDSDSPDHGELYTTVALTGSEHYGQNRYAVTVEKDEPATGELLKRESVIERFTYLVDRPVNRLVQGTHVSINIVSEIGTGTV